MVSGYLTHKKTKRLATLCFTPHQRGAVCLNAARAHLPPPAGRRARDTPTKIEQPDTGRRKRTRTEQHTANASTLPLPSPLAGGEEWDGAPRP